MNMLYELFEAEPALNTGFSNFFANLPIDPYIDGDHRRRAYSRFLIQDKNLIRLEKKPFCQGMVNKLLTNVVREYDPLDPAIDQLPQFKELLQEFADHTGINPAEEPIDIHQIRIISEANAKGSPAPEGIHQDGFRFVGIFCVQRNNIQGGYTQIYESPVEKPLIYTILKENQFIILNDQKLFHYATDTLPENPTHPGIRDVFVLTA